MSSTHAIHSCSRPLPLARALLGASVTFSPGREARASSAAAAFRPRVTIALLFSLAARGAGGNLAAQKAAGNPFCHN